MVMSGHGGAEDGDDEERDTVCFVMSDMGERSFIHCLGESLHSTSYAEPLISVFTLHATLSLSGVVGCSVILAPFSDSNFISCGVT